MKNPKNIIMMGLICCSFFVLSCGSNVFDGFVNLETNNVETMLDEASTVADYGRALTQIQTELNAPDITKSSKQKLLTDKAEALVGKNELPDLLTFVGSVNKVQDAKSSSDVDENLIEKTADLIKSGQESVYHEVAIALNEANDLGDSSVDKLDADQQINRGIYNGMAAVANIKKSFEVKSDGTVTKQDTSKTALDLLEDALYPDGAGVTQSSTVVFAESASNGLSEAGVFKDNQKKQIESVKDAVKNLDVIYKAKKGDADSVIIDGKSLSISDDTALQLAIESVFKGLTN